MSVVDALVAGIIKQEGEPPTATNPGNIVDPVWFPGTFGHRAYYDGSPVHYRVTSGGRMFWVPRTRQEGISAIEHVVWLKCAEGWTMTELIAGRSNAQGVLVGGYAPASDGNDPAAYVAHLLMWTGIDPLKPMWDALHEPVN